jgi:hypothetical protein
MAKWGRGMLRATKDISHIVTTHRVALFGLTNPSLLPNDDTLTSADPDLVNPLPPIGPNKRLPLFFDSLLIPILGVLGVSSSALRNSSFTAASSSMVC